MKENVLEAAKARLREVTHFIGEAHKYYFDPEKFRINLNAAIQSSRNVTFAIQSKKSEIPEFGKWYTEWQTRLKGQSLLKWLVQARNQVVKQGDLKLNSFLRVGLVRSYHDEPQQEYAVPMRFNIEQILERIPPPKLPPEVAENAYLRIERRWVVNDLPSQEIIGVLRYAVDVLQSLIADLEQHLSETDGPQIQLPLPTHKEAFFGPRVLLIRIKDGSLVTGISSKSVTVQPGDEKRLIERYGGLPIFPERKEGRRSLKDIADVYMQYATNVLSKDGYHISFVLLFSDDTNLGTMIGVQARDNAEKYLIWRSIAEEVHRMSATAIVAVSEIWIAPFDKANPHRRPVDAPNKAEGLHVLAASNDGGIISLVKYFTRTESGLKFGEVVTENGFKPFILEPIREVWGLPKLTTNSPQK